MIKELLSFYNLTNLLYLLQQPMWDLNIEHIKQITPISHTLCMSFSERN